MPFREPSDKQESFQGWSPGSVVTWAWKEQGSARSGSLLLVCSLNLLFFGALVGSPQNELCSLEFRRTGTERGSSLECHCKGSVFQSMSCEMSWLTPSHLTFPKDFFAACPVCLGADVEVQQPPVPPSSLAGAVFSILPAMEMIALLMCCRGNQKAVSGRISTNIS